MCDKQMYCHKGTDQKKEIPKWQSERTKEIAKKILANRSDKEHGAETTFNPPN